MEFCERLVEARRRRQLTQEQLADKAGVHVTQLRRYEAGNAEPTLRILRQLAVALSVTTDELVFDKPRGPQSRQLQLAFEAASELGKADQAVVRSVIEGLVSREKERKRRPGARRVR